MHVGHVAGFFFPKTDQHAALLGHIVHREPRAVPVLPLRGINRRQDSLRYDLANSRKVVFQHALFGRHLQSGIDVLHHAATTELIETTLRRDTIR